MATPRRSSVPQPAGDLTIYTVGHSTRGWDEFVAMLTSHGIRAIADVRRYPRSRKFPHFNDESLAAELPKRGLAYLPFSALGGRRRAAKDSSNTGWRSESFRGYADYMLTAPFQQALDELIEAGRRAPTAIMCAEAVPWRCHRSLIADALLARGIKVLDVMDERKAPPHELTPFAKVAGTRVTYPPPEPELWQQPPAG